MGRRLRQEEFRDFLVNRMQAIEAVKHEVDEIQSGFTTNYVEFKARHDALLVRLTEQVLDHFDEIPEPLRAHIERRFSQERARARERCDNLKDLVPQTRQAVDKLLGDGQAKVANYRRQNPQYDQREEALKAKIERLKNEIRTLDENIKKLSGGAGFLLNMGKIDKIDKERQRLVGQYEARRQELHELRQEWENKRDTFMKTQGELQQQWQEKNLELSELRAELELLSDDTKLEELARKRAVYAVLDDLKDPSLCENSRLEDQLREMLVLNHQTDNLHKGLGEVAGLIAWLNSLLEGMSSIRKSVDTLIEQQRMHRAHLNPLNIELPDEAANFHQMWEPLHERVKNDARLSKVPLEFVDTIKPFMEQTLTDQQISGMFDSLGNALKEATKGWRG